MVPCDSGRALPLHSWSTEISTLTDPVHQTMDPNQVLTMALSPIRIF